MKITPLSDVEVSTGDYVLSPGTWDFSVTELEEGTGKTSGKAQLNGKIKATDENGKTSNIFIHLPIDGKGLAHFCAAIGVIGDYKKGDLDLKAYIGLTGTCTGYTTEYQGKEKSQVKYWNAKINSNVPF